MTRNKLMDMYRTTLDGMYRAGNEDDYNTLFDKLIYMNDKKHGRVTGEDEYKGIPENFDFDAFEEDYKKLITV